MKKNITIIALLGLIVFIGLNNVATTEAANKFKQERDKALNELKKEQQEKSIYMESTCLKRLTYRED